MKQKLPNRRQGLTIEFETPARLGKNPVPYTATLSFDEKNEFKEVFIHSGKTGGDLGILMYEASVLLSYCLRHGAKVEDIRVAFPRAEDGRAEGPVGTLLDLYFEELAKMAEEELLS
jgi:hypothetical protein